MKLKTKEITLVSLFVALITIGSKITIPSPIVPFTLQWLFVALSGMLLGPKLGSLSMIVYTILGLMGLPVFTRGGGIGYIVSPTFGYIMGFIAASYVIGKSVESLKGRYNFFNLLFAISLGLMTVYGMGVLYMYLILNFYVGTSITLTKALWSGAIIFIPTDLFSAVLCSLLGVRINSQVKALIDN